MDEFEEFTISALSEGFNLILFDDIKLQAAYEADVYAISSMNACALDAQEDAVVDRNPLGIGRETIATKLVQIVLELIDLLLVIVLNLAVYDAVAVLVCPWAFVDAAHQPPLCLLWVVEDCLAYGAAIQVLALVIVVVYGEE